MSIILSQCFRVRCEPKYIVMKSETSVKHHRESQKEIGLYSGKHDKKIKNIRKYKKKWFFIFTKLASIRWYISGCQSLSRILLFQGFAISQQYTAKLF